MQINPLVAGQAGRIDQPGEKVRQADQGQARARKADAVEASQGESRNRVSGTTGSLAHSSAEEFFALADAGRINANAPRGTYLNLLV